MYHFCSTGKQGRDAPKKHQQVQRPLISTRPTGVVREVRPRRLLQRGLKVIKVILMRWSPQSDGSDL